MLPVSRRYNQNWLPSIFNDFFDNSWIERTSATAPAINVLENEHGYELELAAPGMTKNDFKVRVENDNELDGESVQNWLLSTLSVNNIICVVFIEHIQIIKPFCKSS